MPHEETTPAQSSESFIKEAQSAINEELVSDDDSVALDVVYENTEKPAKVEKVAQVSQSLTDLQKMWDSGKQEDVIKLIGRGRINGAFGAIRQERRKLASRQAEAVRYVDTIVDKYKPFLEAREAFENGDIEAAIQKAFGISITEFGKRHVSALANPKAVDPRVDALKAEIEELRKTHKTREASETLASQKEAVAKQRAELVEALAEIPEYTGASENDMFVDAVIIELRDNWDGEDTISIEEAGKRAYKRWIKGREPAANAVRKPGKTVKKTTQLSKAGAGSTPSALEPGNPETLNYFAREAAREYFSQTE
jgi:hypothetical protein